MRILKCISKDEKTDCWIYTGHLDRYGYGQISDNYKTTTVHRCMFKIHKGDIPEGLVVSHICDTKYPKDSKDYRRCCNPAHLEAVTNAENSKHMAESGRSVISSGAFKKGDQKGEKNSRCKISNETIKEIHLKSHSNDYSGYGQLMKLALEYDISYVMVQKIKAGTYRPECYRQPLPCTVFVTGNILHKAGAFTPKNPSAESTRAVEF